jgi:hypothetical protein
MLVYELAGDSVVETPTPCDDLLAATAAVVAAAAAVAVFAIVTAAVDAAVVRAAVVAAVVTDLVVCAPVDIPPVPTPVVDPAPEIPALLGSLVPAVPAVPVGELLVWRGPVLPALAATVVIVFVILALCPVTWEVTPDAAALVPVLGIVDEDEEVITRDTNLLSVEVTVAGNAHDPKLSELTSIVIFIDMSGWTVYLAQ